MALEDIFNIENLYIDYLIKSLFKPENLGGISIPRFLRESFRELLFTEVRNLNFEEVPRKEGRVLQEYAKFALKFLDINEIEKYPMMQRLVSEYSEIYKKFSRLAYFKKGKINSLDVIFYKEGSMGVGPHLDKLSEAVNLISIFCIHGNARFAICKDRDKSGSTELETSPGSLILLRAQRNEKENNLRLLHYVDNVINERYSLVLRQEP